MARRGKLAGSIDHHRKMVPIEMRRAAVWAKEAHDSAEKNRCTDALREVAMASMFHGMASVHAIESNLSASRIQESGDLILDARDATARCFRRETPRQFGRAQRVHRR